MGCTWPGGRLGTLILAFKKVCCAQEKTPTHSQEKTIYPLKHGGGFIVMWGNFSSDGIRLFVKVGKNQNLFHIPVLFFW